MSLDEEASFLRDHARQSKAGKIRNVSQLKRDYEARVGHSVHKTTIYRLLARNGWRKVAPGTFHTQRDPAQMAALSVSLILPAANTLCMNLHLAEIARSFPAEEVIVVLDGAGWHKSGALVLPDNLHHPPPPSLPTAPT